MIAIVDYGAGNVGSVAKAVRHLGCAAEVVSRPESCSKPRRSYFPGRGISSP